MRLLVTNTQTPQAYAIVRALRPHASRVVATLEGEGWRARLSHAARSRTGRRAVCRAVAGGGVVGRTNRPGGDRRGAGLRGRGRRYLRARAASTRSFRRGIPYVYVLSKHRDRFAAMGVTIPVPGIETVLTALDKYRTVRAGEAVGMPCPETHLYESLDQAVEIGERLRYPVVIKPRFTSGGKGMAIVRDRAELVPGAAGDRREPRRADAAGVHPRRPSRLGAVRRGRDGAVLFAFHKKRHRTFRRTARFGTVSESASPDERLQHDGGAGGPGRLVGRDGCRDHSRSARWARQADGDQPAVSAAALEPHRAGHQRAAHVPAGRAG